MKKILVIREFDKFSRILAENNFEIVNLPLIETSPLDDLSDFEAKLKTIANYDGVFVTSQNAAHILAKKTDELNVNFSGKVYVLGRRSFEILKDKNLDLIFFEDANNAEELLAKIPPDELKNKRFLFVRGEKSLGTIPNFVRNFAAIDEAIVYANKPVDLERNKIAEIIESIKNSEFQAVCFFSPSAAEIFNEEFGAEILHQTHIATIGKTTADFFELRNLTIDFVSPKATAEYFANGLIEYLNQTKMRHIDENAARGTIIINGQEIEGFADDKVCSQCLANRIYYDNYDAVFCPQCNIWLETICSDKGCTYCRNRPEKPLN